MGFKERLNGWLQNILSSEKEKSLVGRDLVRQGIGNIKREATPRNDVLIGTSLNMITGTLDIIKIPVRKTEPLLKNTDLVTLAEELEAEDGLG